MGNLNLKGPTLLYKRVVKRGGGGGGGVSEHQFPAQFWPKSQIPV